MHNANEVWRPPPEPGIVAATLAANDRMAALARRCAGAGEVVRIRQPIDLHRFSPEGHWPHKRPRRVLLIGNYFHTPAQRVDQLAAAWRRQGLEWRRIGHPYPTARVAEEMAGADIVVGYGRSILEAMACGRPAYVHEHSGSDGWMTAETYERLEADGFSGAAMRLPPSLDTLRQDFLRYDPALGRVGHDLARRHDARLVAADIVATAQRIGDLRVAHDPLALQGLRNLAESQHRADLEIVRLRLELRSRPRRSRLRRETARVLARLGRLSAAAAATAWARARAVARRGRVEPEDLPRAGY
jgi:hypothetical protein